MNFLNELPHVGVNKPMKRHHCFLISLMFLAACSAQPDKSQSTQPVAPAQQPAVSAPAPAPEPVETPAPKELARSAVRDERAPVKSASAPKAAPLPAVPAPQAAPQPVAPATAPQPVPQPQVAAATPPPTPVPAPPPPPQPKKFMIPAGTQITVRMIDSIDSDTGQVGQSYRASMDGDLKIDNDVVIPRGSDVYLKLTDVTSAGKMTGKSEVKVQLDRFVIGKTSYPVQSNEYVQEAKSQTAKTAKTVAVGSAIGAIIGGIAGGGKGAVIGAGAGGGGGAAVEAARKSEQVHIASETALVFRLEAPLDVTVMPGASTAPAKNRFVPVP
jgi:hypothetical protein